MRRKSRSSKNARANGSVSSASRLPAAAAALMTRSSTSVRFMMWNTSYPDASRCRRSRSSNRNVRKFPMCAKFQTVGPHVYIVTRGAASAPPAPGGGDRPRGGAPPPGGEIVGGGEQGPPSGGERGGRVARGAPREGVRARQRLVEQQDPPARERGLREREPLHVAARQRRGPPPRHLVERAELQRRGHERPARRPRGVQPRVVIEHLAHGERPRGDRGGPDG